MDKLWALKFFDLDPLHQMTTNSSKRKVALTTDDLLRLQEDAGNKRARVEHTTAYVRDEEDSDVSSEDEQVQGEEEEVDEEDDSEDDSDGESVQPVQMSVVQDRFGPSVATRKDAILPTPPTTTNSFHDLDIIPSLQSVLQSMSIRAPTEVQNACIPPLLQGVLYGTSTLKYTHLSFQ